MSDSKLILVTGATGYIGGRLIPRLLKAGYSVRAMVRREPERLARYNWYRKIEIVLGDVLEPASLDDAFAGVYAAYYFIHSMRRGGRFRERDRNAARNFRQAAAKAGVERIVYLGGLGSDSDNLSKHLKSRQETGQILADGPVPVTEFRAAVVVGSGSVSFEMVRHLTERLPIMIHPRWADTRIQPIAIRDVLRYLVQTLSVPESAGKIIEIGAADVQTFGNMMRIYAEVRGLRRIVIRVPLLTPYLSSYWVHWTTPISAEFARPLIEGAINEVVVRDNTARSLFPDIKPLDYRTAVKLALRRIENGEVETVWKAAASSSIGDIPPYYFTEEQGMYIERRERRVNAPPEAVFRAFTGIGGDRGWTYHWLWQIRGLMDRAVGGVGLRRGRRHPDELWVGDELDFWRVERIKKDALLLLRAEMKVPGKAWLRFTAEPAEGGAILTQTAFFAPKGLFGFLYWYTVYPLHGPLFNKMIEELAETAEAYPSTAT